MSPFPTLIQLTDFPGSIQNFLTVVCNFIFGININLAIPLTCDDLDYFFTNDGETKVING